MIILSDTVKYHSSWNTLIPTEKYLRVRNGTYAIYVIYTSVGIRIYVTLEIIKCIVMLKQFVKLYLYNLLLVKNINKIIKGIVHSGIL